MTVSCPKHRARHERILNLAEGMLRELPEISLNAIDGEFLWRICRAEIADQFQRPEGAVALPEVEPGPGWEERVGEADHAWCAAMEAVWKIAPELEDTVPIRIQAALLAGTRVALHPVEVHLVARSQTFPGESTLFAEIRSGDWAGSDVEKALMQTAIRFVSQDPLTFGMRMVNAEQQVNQTIMTRVASSFHSHPSQAVSTSVETGPDAFPFIAVEVPFPLPAPGIIALHYDGFVADQKALHRQLPGGRASTQDKAVAIRCWSIALLMASGTKFNEAQRIFSDRCRMVEVSQSQFYKDRTRLFQCVPQVKPYLLHLP